MKRIHAVLAVAVSAFTTAVASAATPAPSPSAPSAQGSSGHASISVSDFFKKPEIGEMAISPDGRYLALTIPFDDGGTVLYIVDHTTKQHTASIQAGANAAIDQFWWVNNTRLVASIAEQLGGVDKPRPNGELYAINADGSGAKQLFGYRGERAIGSHIKRGGERRYASAYVIDTVPGDDKNILVQTFDWTNSENAPPSVELLDVYSGNTRRVGVGPKAGSFFVADHRGQVRVAYAPDADLNTVIYVRGGSGEDWRVFNDPKTSKVYMTPRLFARDNRHLYADVSRPNKPDALYRIDLEDGSKELLYEGGADPGELLLAPDRQDAYGVVTRDGKTAFHVFDPASPDAHLALAAQKAFPGQVAVFVNFANDGKFGLLHVFSDRNPGDFYLFDTTKKNAQYIGSQRRWLDPEQLAPKQAISFKARDGVELHGYLTLPRGESKNLPLVVNPHGGPHGIRDDWEFSNEEQLLANRGYAVLRVNYRGSGGYGADFLKSGYGQWGLAMQDDVTDATLWAVQQGYADPKRLCIYGASYGGYAALEGVVREPDLYRCAIGYVGVYDLGLMYRDGDIPRGLFGKRYLQMVLGTDAADMRKRSPAANADRIKASLMLVAGGRDQRVPISQAEALRSALDARKHPYEWMLKDKEGHGFFRTENSIELYTKMVEFLDASIGRGKGVAAAPPTPTSAAPSGAGSGR
jgi:dipeptidyl aminopeptidase/acylaminoacyl peptidase